MFLNREQGLCAKEDWVSEQLRKRKVTFIEREREAITQDLFRKAMFSDFYSIATGCLPSNLDELHNVYLKGPFVIQIDEMFNIAGTSDKRQADGTGRMLKIIATDGYQNVRALALLKAVALYAILTFC